MFLILRSICASSDEVKDIKDAKYYQENKSQDDHHDQVCVERVSVATIDEER